MTAGTVFTGATSGAQLTITQVVGTTISGTVTLGNFQTNEIITATLSGGAAFSGTTYTVTGGVASGGLFIFGEQVTNFDGDTAKVEQVNLQTGQEIPLAQLRYTVGLSTTSIEVVAYRTDNTAADAAVPAGTFTAGKNYQFGSEIVLVSAITQGSESTTLTVTRAQNGTTAVSHQEDVPVYGTDISVCLLYTSPSPRD